MVMVMMELAMVMGNAAGDVGADHDVDSVDAELYGSFEPFAFLAFLCVHMGRLSSRRVESTLFTAIAELFFRLAAMLPIVHMQSAWSKIFRNLVVANASAVPKVHRLPNQITRLGKLPTH